MWKERKQYACLHIRLMILESLEKKLLQVAILLLKKKCMVNVKRM